MTIDAPRDDWQFVRLYAWRMRFDRDIKQLEEMDKPSGVDELIWQAQKDALISVRDEMKEALDAYAMKERQAEAFGGQP